MMTTGCKNYRSVLRMEGAEQLFMPRDELFQGGAEIVAGVNAPLNAVLRRWKSG